MSFLRTLLVIAPPPVDPKGGGSVREWEQLERELNLKFPDDYKELIAVYGDGSFASFFGVANPFYVSSHDISFGEFVNRRIEGISSMKSSWPTESVPFPVYPEKGGMFPWGYTDNGGTMCWLTEGESSHWSIVCLDDACSKNYDRFELGVVQFIEKWLTDQILVPALTPPDFYPIQPPVFVSTSD